MSLTDDLVCWELIEAVKEHGIDLAALTDLTWDDYIELPEQLLRDAELFDGEVVLMVTGSPQHQRAATRLIVALGSWVGEDPTRGEIMPDVFVKITDRNGYKPDVAWYRPGGVPQNNDWKPLPSLAVEVLSPSTRRHDLRNKVPNYLLAGVEELWIVDLVKRQVLVHRAGEPVATFGPNDVLTTPLLDGFSLPLGSLLR